MHFDGWTSPPESVRTAFEDRGWLALESLVSPAEVTALESAFDEVVAIQPLRPAQVVQWTMARQKHPAFDAYLNHRLWPRLAALLGVERLQLLQDVLLFKPAGSVAPIQWHRDHSYTGYVTPDRVFSVRLSLTDATPRSGCLEVISGSHRWPVDMGLSVGADTLGEDVLERLPADLARQAQAARAPVTLSAGGVSVHHCKTVHGSFANTTTTDQKVIVCHVFDARCRLERSRLPLGATELHFPTDDAGHLCETRFPALRGELSPERDA